MPSAIIFKFYTAKGGSNKSEGHVALTYRNFRPALHRLVTVMRTVPVPVVLLTATLPPFMELSLDLLRTHNLPV